MHYETFLFTRNQRLDFTAFIRPALLTNKEVSTIGGVFNYITDVSRLTPEFPSLYFFPLGAYLLLLRHYDSGRQHAGRNIGVIEGVAVKQEDAADFSRALSTFVEQQADLLNVTATVDEIESLRTTTSTEQEWTGRAIRKPVEPFMASYLDRRAEERLFLPFTPMGRDLLIAALADKRMPVPSFFAFGTNSDVLAQLDQRAAIDIASFFTTDRPSFRNRATHRLSEAIEGYEPTIAAADPSMSLRNASKHDDLNLRAKPLPAQANDETLVEYPSVSMRSKRQAEFEAATAAEMSDEPEALSVAASDDDTSTVLTIRQMRDKVRAEEAANQPDEVPEPRPDPLAAASRFIDCFAQQAQVKDTNMAAWLKIIRPNVEVGGNFVIYQTVIVDLERATGFAMQNATNAAFFVDGKTFVVQQQLDAKAFQAVVAYAQKVTGQSLT